MSPSRTAAAAERVAATQNGNGRPRHTEPMTTKPGHTIRKAGQRADLSEIGTYGLRQYGGYVIEEWLRQLSGPKRAWAYREMMDNDPVVGAILFAIRMLLRGVPFRVEEGNSADAAEFVETCMDDMSHTWGDFISEALSMLGYGYAPHEIVYKQRKGQQPAPVALDDGTEQQPASSRYTDGRIGWRKLPIRAQETLLKWQFDERDDGLRAMEQLDYHGRHNVIPIEKMLLFRTRVTRNSPEGVSILRNGFVPWYRLKNIQEIEAIGIERDLAGLPTLTPPDGVDLHAAGNEELLAAAQDLVSTIRRDEDEGVVLPQAGWKLELLTTGGSRQIDTDAIVRRYEQRIASSCLADFILIGQDAVGSFAMVDIKADLFGVAIDTILDMICEVLNRYAIPRLLAMNGMDVSEPPQIAHGASGRINLEKVGVFLNQLTLAGAQIPWSRELIEMLFTEAGLPANFDAAEEEQAEAEAKPGSTVPSVADANPPVPPQPDSAAPVAPVPAPMSKADRMAAESDARLAQIDAEMAELISERRVRKMEVVGAEKARRLVGALVPNQHGAIPISPVLRQRARLLQHQYETDTRRALGQLGDLAHTAYLSSVQKAVSAPTATGAAALAQRVMARLNVGDWFARTFQPLIQDHTRRVMQDTLETLQTHIGLVMNIPDPEAQKILAAGGTNLGLADIEDQVRQSILQAITDGRATGEGPLQIAQRIRSLVPAGPFVNAGSKYRAELISRNETLNAQRQSALAAYQNTPAVTAVQISDGILEDSDADCIARDGVIVPIGQAGAIQPNHPLCTLSLDVLIASPGELDNPDDATA